jgi:hypothetical protein
VQPDTGLEALLQTFVHHCGTRVDRPTVDMQQRSTLLSKYVADPIEAEFSAVMLKERTATYGSLVISTVAIHFVKFESLDERNVQVGAD